MHNASQTTYQIRNKIQRITQQHGKGDNMANINTWRKRRAGVAGYGKKTGKPVITKRVKKTPWLHAQAKSNA